MASPERKISVVRATGPESVDARLAGLEDEALRLRAEIATLQDDLRWLVGEEADEAEPGWLARGWVRASLLLATVGVVAIVSLPYLLHSDPGGPDRTPAAAARPARADQPAPAVLKAVGQPSISAPAQHRSAEDEPIPAPRPRPTQARRAAPDAAVVATPLSHDNSP